MLMAFGVDARQCQGNLLGRPAIPQKVAHHGQQDGVRVQFTSWTRPLSAVQASLLRLDAGVLTLGTVAPELPADGAGRTVQDTGHGANAVALLFQAGQCHTIFWLELVVVFVAGAHLVTLTVNRCCTSLLNPPLNMACVVTHERSV